MRWHRLVCCLALLPLGDAGCDRPLGGAGSGRSLPPVDDVAKVRVSVRQLAGGAGPKAPCEVTLSERPEIAEVIGWLEEIDWSQKGVDLTSATVPIPDGSIAITTKGGRSYDFRFYWDGGFVDAKANHLIRGGDVAKLRQIVHRVCK